MMNSRTIAFLLAFLATLIYGVSFTVAKEVMPKYVQPFGFIFLRVTGAAILFWASGFLIKSERIDRKDFVRIGFAALFGMALNQLSFFKGLDMTTPISASVIMVSTPILVLVFSSFLLNERATLKKVAGIGIGLLGAVILILFGKEVGNAVNAPLGNFLVFFNASLYALYLIIIKSLTKKYHPITLAKWLYLIGWVMVLPFGWTEFRDIQWSMLPIPAWYRIGFIIVCTSYLTYLFNLYAIRQLKPTTLSIFIYLQPVIASSYALLVGSDTVNFIKIMATLMIFAGVYLVSQKPKEA